MKARATVSSSLFVCLKPLNLTLVLLALVTGAVCKDAPFRDDTTPSPAAPKAEARLPQVPQQVLNPLTLQAANQILQGQGLVFIENRGQFYPRVKFLVKGNGGNLWLTNDGIVFDFQRPASKQSANAAEEKSASLKRLSPAQQVIVTSPLDPGVNLSTLTLTSISVPQFQVPVNQSFNPLIGDDQFATTVDLRPSMDLLLSFRAMLNRPNRLVTWTFTSIDPATGLPPEDPEVGFLAPGENGDVVFGVTQNPQLPTGTVLSDQATVVFDTQQPMNTQPSTNTVDKTPPVSQVTALPGTELCSNFKVQWSGTDVGSGIASYTIYVSDNGGSFTAWQTNTTATSAVYNGQVGHSYGFYSIAQDLVGNIEPGKTSAETTTRVNKGTICGPIGPPTPLGGR